jgi:hypothetical protein
MPTLRKFLCWIFAFLCIVCFQVGVSLILPALFLHHAQPSQRSLFVFALFSVFGVVFAAAWWTNFRGKASARPLGIAASAINGFILFVLVVLDHRSLWGSSGVVLALTIAGLLAFGQPFKHSRTTRNTSDNVSIPGDWTNSHLNKVAGLVVFAAGSAAYFWWTGWLKGQGIPAFHSNWEQIALTLILPLVITTVHESGHAAAGLACGMKVRSFCFGPLQWRMRATKWEFHFAPKGILLVDGATAIVPASSKPSRWHYLCMTVAGPLVNLLTGVGALLIALTASRNPVFEYRGIFALFSAWSLTLAVGNLLPFRTRNGYSDGATILQLLSGGPLADFNIAVSMIGSSLVSPLRPKDYDIGTLRRAASEIAQGRQGLLLRLYAFSHALDCGRIREAAQTLVDAELIFNQSAFDIPVELLTVFVFGNAFVRRDAVAARKWWERLQAQNPTRFTADYWRAASALHWIEGDLERANEAWKKSDALAQKLPNAGAYEFGRYCCTLLRRSLDEAAAA